MARQQGVLAVQRIAVAILVGRSRRRYEELGAMRLKAIVRIPIFWHTQLLLSEDYISNQLVEVAAVVLYQKS